MLLAAIAILLLANLLISGYNLTLALGKNYYNHTDLATMTTTLLDSFAQTSKKVSAAVPYEVLNAEVVITVRERHFPKA
jgi:hypothetical protein